MYSCAMRVSCDSRHEVVEIMFPSGKMPVLITNSVDDKFLPWIFDRFAPIKFPQSSYVEIFKKCPEAWILVKRTRKCPHVVIPEHYKYLGTWCFSLDNGDDFVECRSSFSDFVTGSSDNSSLKSVKRKQIEEIAPKNNKIWTQAANIMESLRDMWS